MVVVWCLKLSEKVVVRQRDKDDGENERGEGGSLTESRMRPIEEGTEERKRGGKK